MQAQWLVLAAIVVAMLVDNFVLWPSFVRQSSVDATRARHALWAKWMTMLWACSALVAWLWIAQGQPLSAVGLAAPAGWGLWAPLALTLAFVALQANAAFKIARMPGDKPKLRGQLGTTGLVMPHTASELPAMLALSLTAGFCEELLFRGFLIWILQPVTGWWPAALVALAAFAFVHAYQGRAGVIRSAVFGAVASAIVLLCHSLWPAIVLHAALDWMGGLVGWTILREPAGALRAGAV
jgi:membrane protease YdiL (CAAX protease family)